MHCIKRRVFLWSFLLPEMSLGTIENLADLPLRIVRVLISFPAQYKVM